MRYINLRFTYLLPSLLTRHRLFYQTRQGEIIVQTREDTAEHDDTDYLPSS